MDRLQPKLIRAQTCNSCFAKQSTPNGIECRFNPPTATPILAGDARGQPRVMGSVTTFPIVQPDHWCKQYKRTAIDERLAGMDVGELRAS